MPSEPFWLPLDLIIALNRAAVEATGESHAIRDMGLLQSALARPQQLRAYDESSDTLDLAVALLFGIARNHAFEQGNKRTGFMAFVAFLEANGCAVHLDDYDRHADLIVGVLEGRHNEHLFRTVVSDDVEDFSRYGSREG